MRARFHCTDKNLHAVQNGPGTLVVVVLVPSSSGGSQAINAGRIELRGDIPSLAEFEPGQSYDVAFVPAPER